MTSAISASATMHRARATASRGPNAFAARLSNTRARSRSPSCAMAIPRNASAAASSRSATRFNAPNGSPGRERAGGGEDHRVHRNPVTLVTHTLEWPES